MRDSGALILSHKELYAIKNDGPAIDVTDKLGSITVLSMQITQGVAS